jgi:RimJ/RimL family protein N-acetyltransferase
MTSYPGYLRTRRLILEAPSERHLPHIEDVYNSAGVAALSGGKRFTCGQAEDYLQYWRRMWKRDGIGYHCVSTIENPEKVIGFAGLNYFESEPEGWLNQFFCFSSDVWGQGVAQEASRATWHCAFSRIGALAVYARTGSWNVRARRACSALEMREVACSESRTAMYVMHRMHYLSVVSQRHRDAVRLLLAEQASGAAQGSLSDRS